MVTLERSRAETRRRTFHTPEGAQSQRRLRLEKKEICVNFCEPAASSFDVTPGERSSTNFEGRE